MTRRTLSSAQTFMTKFIFPAVWIFMFGGATLFLWSSPPSMPPFVKWWFLLAWLVGGISFLWTAVPLKKVSRDGELLYVSNFRREIAVPLSAIDSVTENRWINIHPVTVRFRVLTEFGDTIKFMPVDRWFSFISPHPVVDELRRAAREAATGDLIRGGAGLSSSPACKLPPEE